jgi:hypothetical protein
MSQRPCISLTSTPVRVSAPHVQAAMARAAQAKLPDRPSHARVPAPHVQNALGAVQRQVPIPPAGTRRPPTAQAKRGQILPVRPALISAQVKLPVSPVQRRPPVPQIQAALRNIEPKVAANSPNPRPSSPNFQATRSPAHNLTVQPYMSDHEDVEPLAEIIDALRMTSTGFRAQTTHWQKSGVNGVSGGAVSTANTVISSAVLEWMTLRGFEKARFGPHISGFPFTDKMDKSNRYFLKHYSSGAEKIYGDIVGERKCAERKILVDVEAFLKKKGAQLYRPCLYIFSEKALCKLCEQAVVAFRARHTTLQVVVFANTDSLAGKARSTWDYFELTDHKVVEHPTLYGRNLGSRIVGAKPVKKKLDVTLPTTARWASPASATPTPAAPTS